MSEAELAYRNAVNELMVEANPHHYALFEKGFNAGKAAATAKQRASANAISAAERIYAAYPLKVGKQAALRTIAKVLMTVDAEKLLEATNAYAAAVAATWSPEDKQFIPHPATWYNRGSWEDDPATWRRGVQHVSQFSKSY
jgi:hypothetical protein